LEYKRTGISIQNVSYVFTVHLPCHISVHPQTPANFSLVSATLLINITYYYNHGVCVGFLALSGFKWRVLWFLEGIVSVLLSILRRDALEALSLFNL
jgi:ubiquitin-protein ligase